MKTPFGEVWVEVTDRAGRKVEADVWIIKIESGERFPVDGRYLIEACILPKEGEDYTFTCRFEPTLEVTGEDVETGESLEMKSWYHNLFKWSIGTFDDEWLLQVRKVEAKPAVYSKTAISIQIGGFTADKPFILPFGIAWKETDGSPEQDSFTWFAASPRDMYVPRWEL